MSNHGCIFYYSRIADLLRRVVLSIRALIDEALLLLVALGQPGGAYQVMSSYERAHIAFRAP